MRSPILLIVAWLLSAGRGDAQGVSRSKPFIPKAFADYTNGPIAKPSEGDLNEAIEFGKLSKGTDAVHIAWTYEQASFLPSSHIRLVVATPIYLVATAGKIAAENFHSVPATLRSYAATCGVVRLLIQTSGLSNNPAQADKAGNQFIALLRDGKKVPSLTIIPGLNG